MGLAHSLHPGRDHGLCPGLVLPYLGRRVRGLGQGQQGIVCNKGVPLHGNKQIVAFGSKYVALDATQNSEAQQTAGKAFMNWLVYEANGQDALVNKANLVPAFTNIKLEIADPLGRSIVSHIADGAVIPAIDNFTVMPADHWSVVGASLQKYLSGYSDAATLAQEIQDYWKTVK